jgi:hypothetical protein
VPILHRWEADGRHFLLVRRCLDDPNEKAYSLVFAPLNTPLAEMVRAIGARWRIEEGFETGKALGLEDYQVRGWLAWYRHITLVMLAAGCLAVLCAQLRVQTASPQTECARPTCSLVPLSVLEVRHLLALLLWPPPRSAVLVLAWSWWRRCRQGRARYFHTKRRLATR